MAALQSPLSLEFSRQEHWSGLPFPSPMHESEKWKWKLLSGESESCSVVSGSVRPHRRQSPRLLRPWDFPGKSTGVGCHCLLWGGNTLGVKRIGRKFSLRDKKVILIKIYFRIEREMITMINKEDSGKIWFQQEFIEHVTLFLALQCYKKDFREIEDALWP